MPLFKINAFLVIMGVCLCVFLFVVLTHLHIFVYILVEAATCSKTLKWTIKEMIIIRVFIFSLCTSAFNYVQLMILNQYVLSEFVLYVCHLVCCCCNSLCDVPQCSTLCPHVSSRHLTSYHNSI